MICPRCNGTGEVELTIGELLRERRERMKLSQAQLAELAHVSRTMLSQIESGKSQPTVGLYKRIVEALGGNVSIRFDA
jgi:transcriptional regulator with XRE-family HTH domain